MKAGNPIQEKVKRHKGIYFLLLLALVLSLPTSKLDLTPTL